MGFESIDLDSIHNRLACAVAKAVRTHLEIEAAPFKYGAEATLDVENRLAGSLIRFHLPIGPGASISGDVVIPWCVYRG